MMLRRSVVGLVVLMLGMTLAPADALGTDDPVGPVYASALLELPIGVDCGECFQFGCDYDQHYFVDGGGPDRSYGEPQHACDFGNCPEKHGDVGDDCEGGDEGIGLLDAPDREHLWDVIHGGSTAGLSALVASLGNGVVLNHARQALQVRGCGGSIVMSMPLSTGQLEALML